MELNKLITNVFTDAQIAYLKDLVSQYSEVHPCPERGRDDIYIGNDISQEIKDVVLSYFDQDYYLYHVTYSEYNTKHMNPNLPPHKDPNHDDSSLTFDYQFESTIDWPMCADGVCHDMKDNDAVIFDPPNMQHWRPEITFKQDDYVRIIFFYLKKA